MAKSVAPSGECTDHQIDVERNYVVKSCFGAKKGINQGHKVRGWEEDDMLNVTPGPLLDGDGMARSRWIKPGLGPSGPCMYSTKRGWVMNNSNDGK